MAATSFDLREAVPDDLVPAATVLYDAFFELNRATNPAAVEIDFGTVEVAIGAVASRLEDEGSAGVVAVEGGVVVGLGFTFGGDVNTLSFVAVAPSAANRGIGRAITLLLLEKSRKTMASSVRLVQGAPNTKSFSLYAKLGFRPVEYWNNFVGSISKEQAGRAAAVAGVSLAGYVVREMEASDVDVCSRLFEETMGYDRGDQIREAQARAATKNSVLVTIKHGIIVGFTTGFTRGGYVVARNEEAAIALYSRGTHLNVYILGQLHPTLLRWALEASLTLVRHGSLMVCGTYIRPRQGNVWTVSGNL